jgi:hypothetical protein
VCSVVAVAQSVLIIRTKALGRSLTKQLTVEELSQGF